MKEILSHTPANDRQLAELAEAQRLISIIQLPFDPKDLDAQHAAEVERIYNLVNPLAIAIKARFQGMETGQDSYLLKSNNTYQFAIRNQERNEYYLVQMKYQSDTKTSGRLFRKRVIIDSYPTTVRLSLVPAHITVEAMHRLFPVTHPTILGYHYSFKDWYSEDPKSVYVELNRNGQITYIALTKGKINNGFIFDWSEGSIHRRMSEIDSGGLWHSLPYQDCLSLKADGTWWSNEERVDPPDEELFNIITSLPLIHYHRTDSGDYVEIAS